MQITSLTITLVITEFVVQPNGTLAFAARFGHSHVDRSSTHLFGMTTGRFSDPSFNDDDDDDFDVEAMRRKLEHLMGSHDDSSTTFPRRNSKQGEASTSSFVPSMAPAPSFASSSSSSTSSSSSSSTASSSSSSTIFASMTAQDNIMHVPQRVELELPPAPLLTTMERERRLAEIHLLSQLEQGDATLGQLWTLWFQERGAAAAAQLMEIEELMGEEGPAAWYQAERQLRQLIDRYGVYWAEPVNRLATLMYMQGRLTEAERLFRIVLAVKPFHFGALSGIVMAYAGQQENELAQEWAARRLPTFSPEGSNRRRRVWVAGALQVARESLQEAEGRLLASFGAPDVHMQTSSASSSLYHISRSTFMIGDANMDEWQ